MHARITGDRRRRLRERRTPQISPMRRVATALAAVMLLATGLCASGCRMPVRGRSMELVGEGHEPVRLRGNFREAYYYEGPTEASIYLSEIPLAQLAGGGSVTGQVIHIELLWIPKPGRTPIESTATNATIRQIVMVDGEVGVYGGAGFVWPHGAPDRRARMTVRDASMALLEGTDGFNDLLTPANLRGTFVARRDNRRTLQLRQAVSQIVTDAFNESRFVDARELDAPNPSRSLTPELRRALAMLESPMAAD